MIYELALGITVLHNLNIIHKDLVCVDEQSFIWDYLIQTKYFIIHWR